MFSLQNLLVLLHANLEKVILIVSAILIIPLFD
jgi:hypothetical protein